MSADVKSVPPSQGQARNGIHLPVYMDNHATTPTDARVLDEMLPYFAEKFGNASSRNHSFGWVAEKAVDLARERVAKLIGATAKEIIFTSGATESDNLAIKGVAESREKGSHIITVVTEHRAVLDSAKRLEKCGYPITYLPVQNDGLIDLEGLKQTLDRQTVLVSVMAANNEIGVIQPISEIGKLCRARGVLFHSDVVQAVGKMPVDVNKMNLDLASLSGHKLYGPKGVGALYVRQGVRLEALIDGGGHEHGMRSGTLNVPGIVGLGKACAIAADEMPHEACRLAGLRNRLREKIMSRLDKVYVNGSMEQRLPGNLNLSFAHVESESLLMGLSDVAVSSGSACTSARREPSYVLQALGMADDLRMSSIRFGLGRFNTEAEVDYVADRVVETVEHLRELSPAA
jgi:cysteine desulfurase